MRVKEIVAADKKNMSLKGHLAELRQRILVCCLLVFIFFLIIFPHASVCLSFLQLPSAGLIGRLTFFAPAEAFLSLFKIAFFFALVVSSPVIFYQLWAFIRPALDREARTQGVLFLLSFVLAFISGVIFAFLFLLPAALKFLIGFSGRTLLPLISVSEYVSFVVSLLLGCGVVFEMPVLSYLLSRAGILDGRTLRKYWKYAFLLILIMAAALTPTPDVFNMFLLAMPMLALYEFSIWVAGWGARRKF